ncbi:FadR/GntR family transcriptional regulator [Pseudonocardia pini]|uniref:FadR/GntR family transcriptional regulator n=1 Tax=Pseudonocardia pini TaxID=2758030 RepID=UPI0015EFE1C2|nr:FCD domain-containing protein [Pseudonocardia pini]
MTGTLASRISREIEGEIMRRGWPVGEVLGSEPGLCEHYGVSRGVLREAVRLVEQHGAGRMRPGRNGGLIVCAPDSGAVTQALVIYFEHLGLGVQEVLEAAILLEPLAAGLAAGRVDELGIGRIRRILQGESERRDERGVAALHALHVELGKLSGNPALELFVAVLNRLGTRFAATGRAISQDELDRVKLATEERHSAIADAVVSGDRPRAEATTAAHLDAVSGWMTALDPRVDGRRPRLPAVLHGSKRAAGVAGALYDEIVASGWPVGRRLGSEYEVMARFGVNRAVLREAVRILEFHGVLTTRRGTGGGFFVAAPRVGASVDSVALYLDHRGVGPGDLRAVREAVEIGVLGLVAKRWTEPSVAARLAAGPQGPDGLHTELAELSGNRVLAVFLRILQELWERLYGPDPVAGVDLDTAADTPAQVATAHADIVDALLAGDGGVARLRMRRHLAGLSGWDR